MILIGSKSLNENILKRNLQNSDYDIIVNDQNDLDHLLSISKKYTKSEKYEKYNLLIDDKTVELDYTKNKSNIILESLPHRKVILFGKDFKVHDIEIQLLIKRSHINFKVNFQKTIRDYENMMKYLNIDCMSHIITKYKDFYIERKKESSERYQNTQQKISFNVPNEHFFKKSKNVRHYDHDTLHEIISYPNKPIYLSCKKDMSKALIDMSMFYNLDENNRNLMVAEEATVIALERFVLSDEINFEDKINRFYPFYYQMGLNKLICDLSKGKFQDYVIDNYMKIKNVKIDFKNILIEKLKNKEIKTQDEYA